MKRLNLIIIFFLSGLLNASAQEFIPLWPKNKMPDTKGMHLKDSIRNQRFYQVGTPGMFAFFPSQEENQGSAVIICPGGGYTHITYNWNGLQLAKWFNTLGINAFVLIYRLPNSPDLVQREKGPIQDAQRAIKLIRVNARKWKIDTNKIGIMGASAGGHLAALLGTFSDDVSSIGDSIDKQSFNPDFTILVSPVISMGKFAHQGSKDALLGKTPSKELIEKYSPELHVSQATPPCFIADAFNDPVVKPVNSLIFYQALLDKNISTSFHVFPQGGHGLALRNNPGSANLWTSLCEMWLTEMRLIKNNPKQ